MIAGFTTIIDMTAEDILQRNPRYLTLSKSFDTFFSYGPQLVTPDEVADVEALEVATVHNGRVHRQNRVANMTFPPDQLISFHSQVMTLMPGDVISTGTPGAVVIGEGDRVECRIGGFAPLANTVVDLKNNTERRGAMNLGLDDKVVLVTAASKGLGRAIASLYAAEGATVVLASRRGPTPSPRPTAEILVETGREVFWQAADVTDAAAIRELVATTVSRHGAIHVLINNAGGPAAGGFDAIDDAGWLAGFEGVLMSAVRCIREVLPHMRRAGFGRILNIASSSIKQPLDHLILSNTFRTALLGLGKSLAIELAPVGNPDQHPRAGAHRHRPCPSSTEFEPSARVPPPLR